MDPADVAKLPVLVASLAFVLAFVFGAVANRVNFCTMGAIADIVNFGNWHRMRMWVLAIAVAIVGSAVLVLTGHVDLNKSIYTGARIAWVSAIVGGFLVSALGGSRFQIVAGERRYQAAVQVGLEQLPVVIRDVDDQDFGYYANAGIYWRLGSRFNIGLDLRYGGGTEFEFESPDDGKFDETLRVDGPYFAYSLLLGFGWGK